MIGNGFSKCLIFQLIESICGTYLSGSDISVLPEAIFMFDPGSASSVETTQASHRGGEGPSGPHSKWGEREVQNSSHRLEFCHDTRGHASPTCGSEQQGAVLSIQVLHCGDSGVPRVPVVEVVQLFSFLPVPKTAGRKNIRSVLGSQCKL